MFELIKEILRTILIILLFPVMVIDMKLHPDKWDKIFDNDPMGNPDNPFNYR